MNMTAIRYGDDIIVVDAGMMFPEAELLGVDLVMPDLTFLKENQAQVRALILTHGHEDHIGAVPYFLSEIDVPVYGTAFTLALVERRMEEYDLEKEPRLIRVKPKQAIGVGPFQVEFIHVTHSIVSAVALAITTPLGVIIHTGDFKVDPTPTDNELFDLHTLADYGKRGVLLLLSDSTNADRPGYTESERAVRPRMEEIFQPRRPPHGRLLFQLLHPSHPADPRPGQGIRPPGRRDRQKYGFGHRDRAQPGPARYPRRHPAPPAGRDDHGPGQGRDPDLRARRANPCRRCRASRWITTNTSRWKRATPWCSARASFRGTRSRSTA